MTTITIPTLETERTHLRAPTLADFEPYAEIMSSRRAAYMDGPKDRSIAIRGFAIDLSGWILTGFGYWTVADKTDDRFLGFIGLSHPPYFPERELGWMVSADAEGKGYAYEAARAARDYAFDTLGWEDVVSYIDPPNQRSVALAERLGAVLDARAPRPDATDLVYRHRKGARA